jgi:hypothetical protein
MSEGSLLLKQWLSRVDSPSQRRLSSMLPRVTQPMISNHTRGQQPPLRAIFLYEALTGIPPRAWLSVKDQEEVSRLAGARAVSSKDEQSRLTSLELIAQARNAIERSILTAPEEERDALSNAANSLLLAEADLLR